MPSWKPSKWRGLVFKGNAWVFGSDGEQFTLSVRGQMSITGPLLLIHQYSYHSHRVVTATAVCSFQIAGHRIHRELGGLKIASAVEIERFLAAEIPASIASYSLRTRKPLDEWEKTTERRIASAGMIDSESAARFQGTTPMAALAGLAQWEALFDHPQFAAAKKKYPSSFPNMDVAPRRYLDSALERHNRSLFDTALANWKTTVEALVGARGWIGNREEMQLMEVCLEAPKWPSKAATETIEDASLQFRPSAWVARLVKQHNAEHEAHQMMVERAFFDRVESNPLTDEQARAVICMDDSLLVVAAAGSGKSSTIIAKAGYALKERLCAPEEILLLAFNSDAAQELRDRITTRLRHIDGADRITAKTFHAFGLEIVGAATGKMPTTAPWLKYGRDVAFVGTLIDELCAENEEFATGWNLFRLVYFKGVGRWDELDEPEDYDPTSRHKRGFRTMRNEIVKSKAERLIADWLFIHGIDYEYEPAYKHDTRTAAKRQYRPDFYYPNIDVYHEHWALDANGEPPKSFEGYLEAVAWKRDTHKRYGTTLFETTAHELRTGHAIRALNLLFKQHGVTLVFDPNRPVLGRQPEAPQAIAKLLRAFQQQMKSSMRGVRSAYDRVHQGGDKFIPRMELFLSLYNEVANRWDSRLQAEGFVDFEDMLNQSAAFIETGRYSCKFRMVLADEFQDTSRARLRLIQAVIKASNPQFTAVGDDWQGIYRFAGADISIISNFRRTFPDASVRHLSQTFRCPQSLCDVTSSFVSKNPMQIAKSVQSANKHPGRSLVVYALPDVESIAGKVGQHIEAFHAKLKRDGTGERPQMLLLGRYRDSCPVELPVWQARFGGELEIKFLTIHGSKGLEADHILLLSVIQGSHGFPSQVEDDPILQLAMPEPEDFPFGEERRLMYVALTRAKKSAVIYTTSQQPSQFVVELQNEFGVEVIGVDGVPQEVCPKCGTGLVVQRVNRKTGAVFASCSRFPKCDGRVPFERGTSS